MMTMLGMGGGVQWGGRRVGREDQGGVEGARRLLSLCLFPSVGG